jgi:hypothetical protein
VPDGELELLAARRRPQQLEEAQVAADLVLVPRVREVAARVGLDPARVEEAGGAPGAQRLREAREHGRGAVHLDRQVEAPRAHPGEEPRQELRPPRALGDAGIPREGDELVDPGG